MDRAPKRNRTVRLSQAQAINLKLIDERLTRHLLAKIKSYTVKRTVYHMLFTEAKARAEGSSADTKCLQSAYREQAKHSSITQSTVSLRRETV